MLQRSIFGLTDFHSENPPRPHTADRYMPLKDKPQKSDKMKNSEYPLKPWHILLIALVTLILVTAIFNIDTITCNKIKICSSNFSDFGTFYGGILGTMIAFFGIYFIYRTFYIQEIQLDIFKKDSDLNIINQLYDNILQEINSIQFRRRTDTDKEGQVFNGIDALFNFEQHYGNPNSVLNHLQSVLTAFEHIISLVDNIKFKYDDQKDITLTRIYFLYYEKIAWPAMEKIYKIERSILIEKKHPGIEDLYSKYEELCKKTYKYLYKEKSFIGKTNDSDMIRIIESIL